MGPGAGDLDVALTVRAAVASLPPRERAAVVLRFLVGFSVEEAAAAMRCQPGTVKSLTSHAKADLRDRLGDVWDFELRDEEMAKIEAIRVEPPAA